MRKILLTLLLLCSLTTVVIAQGSGTGSTINHSTGEFDMLRNDDSITDAAGWQRVGTDVILKNIGDDVGIGTSAPSVELDVVGDVTATGIVSAGAIQFDESYVVGDHSTGLLHWDDTDKTIELDMPGGNVSVQMRQEVVIRAKAGEAIDNCEIVYVSGGQGSQPVVSLANADTYAKADGTIAMATEDVLNNQFGYFTTAGLVRDCDTDGMGIGSELYLGTTSGEFTTTEPDLPNHIVKIGTVIRDDDELGVVLVKIIPYAELNTSEGASLIGIEDTGAYYTGIEVETALQEVGADMEEVEELQGFFNGTFEESFDALVVKQGNDVVMTLEQSGGGDLTGFWSTGHETLDCTNTGTVSNICQVTLTEGTNGVNNPVANFVYILRSAPTTLVASTTDWVGLGQEHIKVAYILTPDDTYVASDGPFINQNWNDHIQGTDGQGHMSHMAARSRYLKAIYHSGIGGAGDASTYIKRTDASPDVVNICTAQGIVYQMHPHTWTAKDTAATDDFHVVNNHADNGGAYTEGEDLYDFLDDANSDSMTGKYYNVVLWGSANKGGTYDPMFINLPTCSYSSSGDAEQDVDGCDVFTMPPEYVLESSTGFLIARLTMKHSNPNDLELYSTTDLRGFTSATAASSAGGSGHDPISLTDPTGLMTLVGQDLTVTNSGTHNYGSADITTTGNVGIGVAAQSNIALTVTRTHTSPTAGIGSRANVVFSPSQDTAELFKGTDSSVSIGATAFNMTGSVVGLNSDFTLFDLNGQNYGQLIGIKSYMNTATNGGDITEIIGIDISQIVSLLNGATADDNYGLKVGDIAGATNNYAIKTGTGLVDFGDDIQLNDNDLTTTGTSQAEHIYSTDEIVADGLTTAIGGLNLANPNFADVVNGDFGTSDMTGWSTTGTWSGATDAAVATMQFFGGSTATMAPTVALDITVGKAYLVEFKVTTDNVQNTGTITMGGETIYDIADLVLSVEKTVYKYVIASSTDNLLFSFGTSSFPAAHVTVDDITVTEFSRTDSIATTGFLDVGTDAFVNGNFGWAGEGVATLGATTTAGLLVDGDTNPLVGDGTTKGLDYTNATFSRTVTGNMSSGSAPQDGFDMKGMKQSFTFNSIPPVVFSPTEALIGYSSELTSTANLSTAWTGSYNKNMRGIDSQVTQGGTMTAGGAFQPSLFGAYNRVTYSTDLNGGTSARAWLYGNYTSLYAGTAKETSGTHNITMWGDWISLTGPTAAFSSGTKIGYGLYINAMANFDTAWAYYNNTAADNFMGLDGGTTYFGTAPSPASIDHTTGIITVPHLKALERSSDPSAPSEGEMIIWMSDGTGKGDDGDVLVATTAGGTTKWNEVMDFSTGLAW